MANKFYEWCENSANYENATTFSSDSERTSGFIAGTPAKASKVNTALRQANLIACALTDILIPNDTTNSVESTRANLKTALDTGLTSKIQGVTTNNSVNVTTTINGKNISSIFESNGTTVKKATSATSASSATSATSATNATNVTTTINGKNISSIFESNGTTVKKASKLVYNDQNVNTGDICLYKVHISEDLDDLTTFLTNYGHLVTHLTISHGNFTGAISKRINIVGTSISYTINSSSNINNNADYVYNCQNKYFPFYFVSQDESGKNTLQIITGGVSYLCYLYREDAATNCGSNTSNTFYHETAYKDVTDDIFADNNFITLYYLHRVN